MLRIDWNSCYLPSLSQRRRPSDIHTTTATFLIRTWRDLKDLLWPTARYIKLTYCLVPITRSLHLASLLVSSTLDGPPSSSLKLMKTCKRRTEQTGTRGQSRITTSTCSSRRTQRTTSTQIRDLFSKANWPPDGHLPRTKATSLTSTPQMRTIYSKSLSYPWTPNLCKIQTSEGLLPIPVTSLQSLLQSFEF